VRLGETPAFDGVLVGHQHRQTIREIQIRRRKIVMVRKRVLDRRDAGRAQTVEESLRVADRSYRVHTLTTEAGQRLGSPVIQRDDIAAAQLHQVLAVFGDAAVADAQIHLLQPARRLAQRACRQQPAIAEAARAVDHADFHVARQPVMLQSVVGDQHIATGVEQQSRRGGAIAPHHHRHTAGVDQTGLVANLRRVRRIAEQQRLALTAAVAATDHAGPIAARAQGSGHGYRQRRLAGTAYAEVADHDDRRRQAHTAQDTHPIKLAAQTDRGAVQHRQRPRPPWRAAIGVPG